MPFDLEHPYFENVSIADFDAKFSLIENTEDKYTFLKTYILSHGMDGQPSCSLGQLVAHAKEKFAESLMKDRSDYKKEHNEEMHPGNLYPYNKAVKDEKEQKAFLADPITVLRAYAKQGEKSFTDDFGEGNDPKKMKSLRNNCKRLFRDLYILRSNYNTYEKTERISRVYNSIGLKQILNQENMTPDEIMSRHKGGFFERLFKTTSEEYRNLEGAMNAFENPDSPAYGDLDNLEISATMYLRHKFPNLKDNELPTQDQINSLSGTSKGRAQLCMDIINTVRERREQEIIVGNFKDTDLTAIKEVFDDSQLQREFQDTIAKELAKDELKDNSDLDVSVDDLNISSPGLDISDDK